MGRNLVLMDSGMLLPAQGFKGPALNSRFDKLEHMARPATIQSDRTLHGVQ